LALSMYKDSTDSQHSTATSQAPPHRPATSAISPRSCACPAYRMDQLQTRASFGRARATLFPCPGLARHRDDPLPSAAVGIHSSWRIVGHDANWDVNDAVAVETMAEHRGKQGGAGGAGGRGRGRARVCWNSGWG
jgi:hypothetical protein